MVRIALAGLSLAFLSACGGSSTPTPDSRVSPVYDKTTGRLTELLSDRDGDGKNETRAFMNRTEIERIEIDRNGDNVADRFEFYLPLSEGGTPQAPWMARAEERDGDRVVRREQYAGGRLSQVEEDTDGDARFDKWERYQAGTLMAVELDLDGAGKPTRRLVYGRTGNVERVEADSDGDGVFEVVK